MQRQRGTLESRSCHSVLQSQPSPSPCSQQISVCSVGYLSDIFLPNFISFSYTPPTHSATNNSSNNTISDSNNNIINYLYPPFLCLSGPLQCVFRCKRKGMEVEAHIELKAKKMRWKKEIHPSPLLSSLQAI